MMLRPRFRFAGSRVVVLMIVLASSASAQVTSAPALPVTSGHGIIRVQAKLLRAGDDASGRSLTVVSTPIAGVYGVTPSLAVFGIVPVLHKQMVTTSGAEGRGPTGLGDVRLFARYTIFKTNAPGRTFRVAPFAGVELPTGTSDGGDATGPFAPGLQLGSGSWDPFAGASITWQTLGWQVNVVPAFQRNSAANGFRQGDEVRVDAGFMVRVLPRTLGRGLPRFLFANLETNLIHEFASEADGVELPETGGTTWFVGPGVQFVTQRYVLEGALQLPVLQDIGVGALRRDYIATLSARLNL